MNENDDVKIGDFGLARDELYEAKDVSKSYNVWLIKLRFQDSKYPIRWAPPEVMKERKFSIKATVLIIF